MNGRSPMAPQTVSVTRSDIYKRDASGALIQATREAPPQPALLIKAAASLLAATYGERVAHTHMIGGVVRIGPTQLAPKQLAPPPTFQVLDADFTPVEDEKPLEPTNILAVAEEPETVEEYERTFGGKRLVEAILFYAEDGTSACSAPRNRHRRGFKHSPHLSGSRDRSRYRASVSVVGGRLRQ